MQSVSHDPNRVNHIRVYPTLAHASIKQEQVPSSRVWLLLRTLDPAGKGWINLETAKRHLTHNRSSLRLCGWRRLRQIIAQGEGIFWSTQNRRLWLYGAGRVAQELGISKLAGRPVLIPLSALTTNLKTYRAHLYTTFHTSRPKDANPISRQTLTQITGVSPRAQRTYDHILRTKQVPNYVLTAPHNQDTEQELLYEHGFIFKFRGYWARQIGNQYVVTAQIQAANGRKKKINRKLSAPLVGQLAKLPFADRRNCAVDIEGTPSNLRTHPNNLTKKINRRLADLVTSRAQGNGSSALAFATASSQYRVRASFGEMDSRVGESDIVQRLGDPHAHATTKITRRSQSG